MKFKSCVLASILGLLNIIPGTTNAKFVINLNFPWYYTQSLDKENGILWLVSRKDDNKVCYVLLREYAENEKGWKFVNETIGNSKDYQKCHYKILTLNEGKSEIYPRSSYNSDKSKFYSDLFQSYKRAEKSYYDPKYMERLVNDNPLDNLGWFYSGRKKENEPLIQRVIKFKERDEYNKCVEDIKFESYGTNYEESNCKCWKPGFTVPKNFDHYEDWKNKQKVFYQYFKDNLYLQHMQYEPNDTVESMYNTQAFQEWSTSKKQYTYNDCPKDIPLQNQKLTFFSPLMPEWELQNNFASGVRYNIYTTMSNEDFYDLPLISLSDDMAPSIERPLYTGEPKDVIKMFCCNELLPWMRFSGMRDQKEDALQGTIRQFTNNEIRIPTYTFASGWKKREKYDAKKSEKQKETEEMIKKSISRQNFKRTAEKLKLIPIDNDIDESNSDSYEDYNDSEYED